jgi:hypothetical protein
MLKILIMGIILGLVIFTGCNVNSVVDKEKNICGEDSDCEYIWFTGRCNTPEYVAIVVEKCHNKTGPCLVEAQEREGVTCTCENNSCITHG